MRVTNNMIMKNSIRNINRTKEQTSKLNDQMTTQKKITKASENPVIAIRSLRLRNTQAQVEQYLTNNINDAETWIDNTEEALNNIKEALNDAYSLCNQAATSTNSLSERKTILQSLQSLVSEVYQEANADLNGRSLFTGYKTGQTLTFTEDEPDLKYTGIVETFSYLDLEQVTYFSTAVNPDEYTDSEIAGKTDADEVGSVTTGTFYRLRLSYDECNGSTSAVIKNLQNGATLQNGTVTPMTKEDWIESGMPLNSAGFVYLYDTGELIVGSDWVTNFQKNQRSISITYDKTGFDKDDIRPEMYFDCVDATNKIEYTYENQPMSYTIASNTTLEINQQAAERDENGYLHTGFLDADFLRDIEDLSDAIDSAQAAQDKVDAITEKINSSTYAQDEDAQAYLANLLSAAQQELDYATENVNNLFSKGISSTQSYIENLANAISDVGNVDTQLSLVKTRVTNQQSTVKELISDNEDLELTSIVIEYTAAYNAYEAALMAASKASQNTLLDFI